MRRQQLLLVASLLAVGSLSHAQTVWDGSEADDFWFNADNWDTGIAPTGPTAQAVVGVPSPTLTNGTVLLQSLSVTADGVLNVGISQNFNFATGAATSLTNAGSITALNNSDLQVLGMVNNTGSITIASTGNQTDLEVANGGATLAGGGTVTLSGPNAGINDFSGTQTLTIADQTIQGRGNIGRNTIDVINQANGFIHANVNSGVLVIDPAALFTNSGVLRASSGGVLRLLAGDFVNTGGTIEALTGSEVSLLTGARIVGGVLSTTGDGIFRSAVSTNVEFEDLTLNGTYESGNNSDTRITGTITNTGSITIASILNQTDLEVAVGGATLTGGGTVTLAGGNAGINDVSGTQTLTIANQTIQGQGDIGRNTTDFDNQGNLIHANVSGQVLTIDPAALFANSGTLRASGGGVLELQAGNFVNTGGTIEALAGSQVSLITGTRIVGGVLSTTGDGIIRSAVSASVEFEDLALNGTYESGDNSDTRITGTINNTGSITIASAGNQTNLEIAVGDATLAGGGTVTLAGDNAGINDASGTQTLIIANQTIQGRGDIGRNTTDFDNQGNLIHANVSEQILVLDPAEVFTNTGTLRASGGGILELRDGGAGDFVNAGGTIEALAGSQVSLITGARIVGGTLSTTDDGIIRSAISADVEFEDLTLNGSYESGNNSDTRITGTITNTGSITIASTGNQTDLEVADGGATLTGGGTVTLTGANAGINDASGTQTLIIADQTIQGQGNIGRNTADFDNQGNLIHANVSGQVLRLDAANLFTNSGTLRASGGGILELRDGGTGDFVNTGGTIEALAGSQVSLTTGARIIGGVLSTTDDGIIRSPVSAGVEFEDLTLNGSFESGNNSDTRIKGTISNTGSITIASTGSQTDLEVADGGATLTGGGTVTLSGANAGIRNATGTQTLVIEDQTVQGRGNIDVDLVNNGALVGDSDSDVIRINAALAGDGRLRNVSVGRAHRPGDPGSAQSTASVPVEGLYELRTGSSLLFEIGGPTAGDDFDQLVSDDPTNRIVIGSSNTTLGLSLIKGFSPSIGDTFTLIDTAGTLEGEFDDLTLTGLPNLAFIWDVQYTEDRLIIELMSTFPLPGDFNADGKVDLLDLDILGANFGSTNASGGDGDANDDGNVDLLDLDILGSNFGAMAPTSATAIPEPAAIWLMLAALSLGRLRCPR